MTTSKRQFGFTLVELLAVVAIIALLISLLVPSLNKARQAAQQAVCSSNLHQIGMAIIMYAQDYKGTYPCANDPVSTSPSVICLWMGRGWRPMLDPYLRRGGNQPSVYWCPADETATQEYDSTSYAYSMCFYHDPATINQLTNPTCEYAVSPNSASPLPPPSTAQKLGGVAMPSQKILGGEWYSNHQPLPNDPAWWGPLGRRVFLFADMHVQPLAAKEILPANDNLPDPNLTHNGIRGRDVP